MSEDFQAVRVYAFENEDGWGSPNGKGFFERLFRIRKAPISEIVLPEEYAQFELGVPNGDARYLDSFIWKSLFEGFRYAVEVFRGLLAGNAIQIEKSQDYKIRIITEDLVERASGDLAFEDGVVRHGCRGIGGG